jgi:hypothetical protein
MRHTYRQVFTKLLPEPYRSQAIANTINSGSCADDPEVFGNCNPDDIEDALLTAFTWSETPEGHGYWSEASRSQFPAAGYRILEVGETIQEGDEVRSGSGGWLPVAFFPVRCCLSDSFRRRVAESEAPSPNPESRIADLESRVAVLEGLVLEPGDEVATPPPSAVDPGEGYRLLDIGEAILAGDEEADDEAGGGWSPICFAGDEFHPHNWYPVRRKITPPTYRLLNPGEIIRETDEAYIRNPRWRWEAMGDDAAVGLACDPSWQHPVRRLVKSYEDA